MAADTYDALAVAARVAGATLATLLGNAGYPILLVDRATFPSDNRSSHYFRGGRGVSVLTRLGVLDAVRAFGCPSLTRQYRSRQYRYPGGAVTAIVGPPQEPSEGTFCLSVRRTPSTTSSYSVPAAVRR